jgi:glycine oxidase
MPVPMKRGGRLEILNSVAAAERARQEAEAACGEWSGWPTGEGPIQQYVEAGETERRLGIAAPFGALRCEATAQVHVPSLVRGLVAACAAERVEIREGIEAAGLKVEGGRVRGVETSTGSVSADAVLLCAGAWASAVGGEEAMVRPAKGQGIAVAVSERDAPGCILKRGPIYLVPWPERGEVLVGSTTEPEAGFDETPTEEARRMLLEGATALWPGLDGAKVVRHWGGLRPDGPKHRPIMRASEERRGLWICCGHYKTGIGMAGETGALMAGAMLRGETLPVF